MREFNISLDARRRNLLSVQKYVSACGGDTRRAMTLYRYNLKLSQEMFTLISCFEVALRNRIDSQMVAHFGNYCRQWSLVCGNIFSLMHIIV